MHGISSTTRVPAVTLHHRACRAAWLAVKPGQLHYPMLAPRTTHTLRQNTMHMPPQTKVTALPPEMLLADLDASTARTLSFVLRPLFTVATLLFIVRIVMTWFPEQVRVEGGHWAPAPPPCPCQDGKQFPWSLSYTPTEPLLAATRKVVPPLAGVDVSPIVWVALLSFFNEILLGPQGILNLIERQAQL